MGTQNINMIPFNSDETGARSCPTLRVVHSIRQCLHVRKNLVLGVMMLHFSAFQVEFHIKGELYCLQLT